QSLMYKLDRAVRLRFWQGIPDRQVWSCGRYLLFQLQAGMLPVLIPLGLLIGLIDCLELMEMRLPAGGTSEALLIVSLIVGVGLIVLITPVLIRWAWGGRAMRAGPMREKLEGIGTSGKLNYRDIIVWPTANTVANAAVMGFWGPLRYVVVTDGLLKDMSAEEVQAVFGHEVGHIRGHHLWYYGLFMVGINLLVYDCLKLAGIYSVGFEQGTSAVVLQFALLMAGFVGLFGWISRRFERHADVWAIEHMGCPGGYCQPGCPLYDLRRSEEGSQPQGPPKDRLCPPAVKCFTGALQRVALLNAIPQKARSWRHSSIGSRVDLLYRLSSVPGELKRFHWKVRLVKICLWAGVIGGGIGALVLQMLRG
ncbi:MAG: M48 family metalloprotease, partial [Actinobacteria bacterium]|nr:M48 family metalloprotease [Actinomycetota bacterium]